MGNLYSEKRVSLIILSSLIIVDTVDPCRAGKILQFKSVAILKQQHITQNTGEPTFTSSNNFTRLANNLLPEAIKMTY